MRGRLICAMRAILVVSAILAVTAPSPARAQEWLRDRRHSQGPGIVLSDSLVLHAGIAVEGGYDSNVFYAGADGEPEDSGRVRVTPQVELATRPPQRIENPDGSRSVTPQTADFHLNVAGIYNQYIATGGDANADAVMDQSDFGIQSGLGLTVYPQRPWSFVLRNLFMRTIDPPNEIGPANYNRIYDRAELGVQWKPGGGAFELNLLGGATLNIYEQSGPIANVGNYVSPGATVSGRWKFYPNTALTFESSFEYANRFDAGGGSGPGGFLISSSYPVRSWIGLNGQWTPLIATSLRIGYGAGFYDEGEDFDSVLAQAEVAFLISPTGRLKFGFLRDFVDSFFSNFYERNQGYARWEQMFGGAFLIGLQLNVRYLEYATLYNADGTRADAGEVNRNPRADTRIDGVLFAEYRVKDWLAFNATVSYENNITGFRWAEGAAPDGSRDESYWKLMAFLGARVVY